MKKFLLGTILCLVCICCSILAITGNSVSANDKEFTTQPNGGNLGVNGSINVAWETNFDAEEFKILYYDVNSASWDVWATQTATSGKNGYTFTFDQEISMQFKIQAIIGGESVLESELFKITWTKKPILSYLPNGGSGNMPAEIVEGNNHTLSDCSFDAPTGKIFYGWDIDGIIYSAYKNITVTKSTVAVAVWKKEVNLPIVIDGTSIVGAKTPELAKLSGSLPESEEYDLCNMACCNMQVENDSWYEADENIPLYGFNPQKPATHFENGKIYVYFLAIHPSSGYMLPKPNDIKDPDNDIIQINGISWLSQIGIVFSQVNLDNDVYFVKFSIKYDSSKGIPGIPDFESGEELSPIQIDGSPLVGIKEPQSLPLGMINGENYYTCTEDCSCSLAFEGKDLNNRWIDLDTIDATNEFINGTGYVYYLFIHAKDGYVFPEDVTNFITITSVEWLFTDVVRVGDVCLFGGAILYNDQTGITGTAHVCKLSLIKGKDATCTENGIKSYYECICEKKYEDEEGKTLISDVETWKVIPALGHAKDTAWKNDEQNHFKECVNCDEMKFDSGEHIDTNSNGSCDICGYKMQVQTPSKKKGCKSALTSNLSLLFLSSLLSVIYILTKKRKNC